MNNDDKLIFEAYINRDEDSGTTCPWCQTNIPPVPTDADEANIQYGDRRDPRYIARNPAMCPECKGVGGWEDWGLDEAPPVKDETGEHDVEDIQDKNPMRNPYGNKGEY